ncbi:hypothetical protein [Haloarchaeobius sp. DFWS5]|uniref:hypothetical protein n=1 Tax=Haloarchaeobius sp. DFWS5 TaxID=3446114 RepID=UPI003EBD6D18
MRHRTITTVALALVVLLAGCTGAAQFETRTADDGAGGAGGDGGGDDLPDATHRQPDMAEGTQPSEAYDSPAPPNVPTESNLDEGNRIESVELVNTAGSENGLSDFDVRVTANTMMESIDPAEHGDAEGEPYFIVAVDGSRIARSDYVAMEENGEFVVQVHPDALTQYKNGQHEITVYLFDQDSEHDDVYGKWTGTFYYEQ